MSAVFLVGSFFFISFVANSCVAAQKSTEIRKYVTGADSALSDSANMGNEHLQAAVSKAVEDPANADAGALSRAAEATQKGYQGALRDEEVPPEFEDAHHYMVTALGIRAAATRDLTEAAGVADGDREAFDEALSSAAEEYKLSDAVIGDHYVPASEAALAGSGREGDQNYLYEPRPFMDYEALGLSDGARPGARSAAGPEDPGAVRDVAISGVQVASRPLFPNGNVLLTGADELVFSVTVYNGGEVAETGLSVEIVLNTRAERQAIPANIERIEPGGAAIVEVRGFKPGELDETAAVVVEVEPVKREQDEGNNALSGTVTFGI